MAVIIQGLPGIPAGAQSPPSSIAALQPTAEDEVLANIRSQRVGDATLEAFNLPDDFLRRVADRVIRSTYMEQFHVVIDDRPAGASAASSKSPDASAAGSGLPEAAPGSARWAWAVGAIVLLGVFVVALRALTRKGQPS